MRTPAAILISGLLVLTAACGQDTLDEQEFVDDLTGYDVPESAARCVYAQIVDDADVIADIKANGVGDEVSSATADRLEEILTGCLRRDAPSRATTTSSPTDTDGG